MIAKEFLKVQNFDKTSKSQNIMKMIKCKVSFVFYVSINSFNIQKQSYLGWNLLYLSKKHPKTNSKVFQ